MLGFGELLSVFVGQARRKGNGPDPRAIQKQSLRAAARSAAPAQEIEKALMQISAKDAVALLSDRSPTSVWTEPRGVQDPRAHSAVLNSLRYRATGVQGSLAAELGVRAADQGLQVDQQWPLVKGIGTKDYSAVADIVMRSELTTHWRGNINRYAKFLASASDKVQSEMSYHAREKGSMRSAMIFEFAAQAVRAPGGDFTQIMSKDDIESGMLDMVAAGLDADDPAGLAEHLGRLADQLEARARGERVDLAGIETEYRRRMRSDKAPATLAQLIQESKALESGQLDAQAQARAIRKLSTMAGYFRRAATQLGGIAGRAQPPGEAAGGAGGAAQTGPPPVPLPVDQDAILHELYAGSDVQAREYQRRIKFIRQVLSAMGTDIQDPELAERRANLLGAQRELALWLVGYERVLETNRDRLRQAARQGLDSVDLVDPHTGEERTIGLPGSVRQRPEPTPEPERPAVTDELVGRVEGGVAKAREEFQSRMPSTPYMSGDEKAAFQALVRAHAFAANPEDPVAWLSVVRALGEAAEAERKIYYGRDNRNYIPDAERLKDAKRRMFEAMGLTPALLGVSDLGEFKLADFDRMRATAKAGQYPTPENMLVGLEPLLDPHDGWVLPAPKDKSFITAGEAKTSASIAYELVRWLEDVRRTQTVPKPVAPPAAPEKAAEPTVQPAPPKRSFIDWILGRQPEVEQPKSAVPPRPKVTAVPPKPPVRPTSTQAAPGPTPAKTSVPAPPKARATIDPGTYPIKRIELAGATPSALEASADSEVLRRRGEVLPCEAIYIIDGDTAVVGIPARAPLGDQYCMQVHVRLRDVSAKRSAVAEGTLQQELQDLVDMSVRIDPTEPVGAYDRWSGIIYGERPDGSIARINVDLKDLGEQGLRDFDRRFGDRYPLPPEPPDSEIMDSLGGAGARDDLFGLPFRPIPIIHKRPPKRTVLEKVGK